MSTSTFTGQLSKGFGGAGVDLLTVQDDGYGHKDDPILLDRALAVGRVMVSQDTDFLREGRRRQMAGEPFAGVIYAPQDLKAIGRYIVDLELIAKIDDMTDWMNQVKYLPL